MSEPLKNVADPIQVREAEKKERFSREGELNDLRKILGTKEGRRLLWRILEQCKVYSSIWEPSAKIHYYAGRQDLGHFILAEIVAADDEAYIQMMRENKQENLKNG